MEEGSEHSRESFEDIQQVTNEGLCMKSSRFPPLIR